MRIAAIRPQPGQQPRDSQGHYEVVAPQCLQNKPAVLTPVAEFQGTSSYPFRPFFYSCLHKFQVKCQLLQASAQTLYGNRQRMATKRNHEFDNRASSVLENPWLPNCCYPYLHIHRTPPPPPRPPTPAPKWQQCQNLHSGEDGHLTKEEEELVVESSRYLAWVVLALMVRFLVLVRLGMVRGGGGGGEGGWKSVPWWPFPGRHV